MEMNWIVIVVVSIIAFAMAPLWFGAFFGKLWQKIHGWENMSKDELKAQEKGMGKLLVLEGINTLIMISVLAFLLVNTSGQPPMLVAFLVWLGFIYPSVLSSIIWGGDKKQWQCKKIAILTGFNFIVLMLSAFLLSTFS